MTHNTTAAELEKLLAETTPGDWRTDVTDYGMSSTGGAYVGVYTDDLMSVAHILCTDHAGRGASLPYAANARLIAIAPTLARKVIAAEKLAEAGESLNEQAAHVRQGASIRGMDITHAAIELGPLVLAFDDALTAWEQDQ